MTLSVRRLFVRAVAVVRRLTRRRHHDDNQKTRQFRGCLRVGFLRPHGPQHGGAE